MSRKNQFVIKFDVKCISTNDIRKGQGGFPIQTPLDLCHIWIFVYTYNYKRVNNTYIVGSVITKNCTLSCLSQKQPIKPATVFERLNTQCYYKKYFFLLRKDTC